MMVEPSPFDALQTFGADAQPIFESQAEAKRDTVAGIESRRAHVDRDKKRRHRNMLKVANAARELERLPGRNEALHLIMRCNFDAFDFVPAVLQLASPATIRELNLATLGFNAGNAARLLDLLDTGRVQVVSFLCSNYYKTNEGEVYDALWHELDKRGHRAAALRSHAKVVLFELTDGRCITLEMSANLRSCRSIEQATFVEGEELLHFHRGWMNELLDGAYDNGTTRTTT